MTDLKYAWRMVKKSPLFTTVVVVTLALGIGLNTAVFATVEALLLRPLPATRAPEELVGVYRAWPGDQRFGSNSVPHYIDIRDRSTDVFDGVLTWGFIDLNVTANGVPQRIFGQIVSANYFDVLGADAPQMGRYFTAAEDSGRLAHPIIVLSDAGWKAQFGGDPSIVGRDVVLNGQNYRVVGVAPPEFVGTLPLVSPVMWVPLMQIDHLRARGRSSFENRGNNFMNVIGRLKPGVSIEQAHARLVAINAELVAAYPDDYERVGITTIYQKDAGIHPTMRDAQVGLSAVVMAVVLILLLIACVNVANLFLARSRDRAREMAVRIALGAKRGTLVRQLLVESVMFSVIAGAAGLLLALWVTRLTNGIELPVDVVLRPDVRLSAPVLLFAFGMSVATGVIFGLVPALQATRPSLIPALKGESPAGGPRSRITRGLIVAQMALSIVLLVCAGLFLGNLRSATNIDKGFVADQMVIAEFDPSMQGYDRARSEDFYRRLGDRLRSDARVRAVGFVDNLPLGLSNSDRGVEIPGYTPAENERMNIQYATVDAGYFEAMQIPVIKGRAFTAQDDSAAVRAIVVNERFAQRFWPDQEPLGRVVRLGGGRDFIVVGVVPTGKYVRLGEEPTPYMYLHLPQMFSAGMGIVVRARAEDGAAMQALRETVRGLDPNLPVANLRTMDSHLGISLLPARITGIALGVFGLLGLVLASVGMYGVMAYSVSQRRREIGIRMAIGAATQDVVGLVMRQGLTLVGIGVVLGLAGAVGAAQLLKAVLYGGNPMDLTTFTVVPLVLLGVSALATWGPARKAATVDPAITLRSD